MIRIISYSLLGLLLFFQDYFGYTSSYAAVWHVYPEKSSAIQRAISNAHPGDSVFVHPGLYREGNIRITKKIYLAGIDYPTLDGEHKVELITIEADDVTVKGFVLMNSAIGSMEDYAAIRIQSAKRVTIEGNKSVNNFFGFHFSKSEDCMVRGNRLENKKSTSQQLGNGIHLWKCNGFIIENNFINGHRDGIYFEFVTNSRISKNYSQGNLRYGLHFMFSNDDSYLGNRFTGNGAGVAVMYSSRVLMEANTFDRNWGPASYGLLLKDIRDSEARGNLFERNTAGIYMEGSSRIHFSGNEFRKNGWAVRIQASCDGNTFERSNFFSNTFDIATNGTLVLNRFSQNYWDRYQGYDLDRNGMGDVPYHPMNFFSSVVERTPSMLMLWRSFFIQLLDWAEKVIPVLTPETLKDDQPSIRPYDLLAAD